MQPPTNPLIEATVRPLSGNAEQRLAAISIALLPSYAVAIILISLLLPVFTA